MIWCENSPAYNCVDVDLFSVLQTDIVYFQSFGTVLLCGDMNARVGNGSRPDYIAFDRCVETIDGDDYSPDVPLPRYHLIARATRMDYVYLICVNQHHCVSPMVDWAVTI